MIGGREPRKPAGSPTGLGCVASVNVGPVGTLASPRRNLRTAIVKRPVARSVEANGVNLAGDDQADREVHGGPDRSVLAYAVESYMWWARELDRELAPGTFGENLTVAGVEVDGALVGERWRIGTVTLEVSGPRVPCAKLAARMGDPAFVKRFADARRPGAYLRIIKPGTLKAGDAVEVIKRPDHDVTIRTVSEAVLHDHSLAAELVRAPELAAHWRAWAAARLAISDGASERAGSGHP